MSNEHYTGRAVLLHSHMSTWRKSIIEL